MLKPGALEWLSAPFWATQTAAIAVCSSHTPPPNLKDLVARISLPQATGVSNVSDLPEGLGLTCGDIRLQNACTFAGRAASAKDGTDRTATRVIGIASIGLPQR